MKWPWTKHISESIDDRIKELLKHNEVVVKDFYQAKKELWQLPVDSLYKTAFGFYYPMSYPNDREIFLNEKMLTKVHNSMINWVAIHELVHFTGKRIGREMNLENDHRGQHRDFEELIAEFGTLKLAKKLGIAIDDLVLKHSNKNIFNYILKSDALSADEEANKAMEYILKGAKYEAKQKEVK